MKEKYLNLIISFLMILIFCGTTYAQNGDNLWTKISKEKALSGEQISRKYQPSRAVYYHLNMEGFKAILQDAPERGVSETSNLIVKFPDSDGKLEAFKVMEAPVMHRDLQAQYPYIKSYVAQSINHPSYVMRFSITPDGLHTMTLGTDKGTQYIDPSAQNSIYMVYSKSDLPNPDSSFICEVVEEASSPEDLGLNEAARNANDGTMRRYDLALGCSAEYTNFHGGNVPSALAAMVVSITRVSSIYERDFSIRLQLVANNDLLISTSANQIFGNTGAVLNTATSIINGIIGSANYDIGHVFTTAAGGIAGVAVVCVDTQKGKGTTGVGAPIGDPFNIDYVAHEMGHQFGGSHTFNGTSGSCGGGNRQSSSAYEPGSGSTIMAYAGICNPQNVQNNSDDYFHRRSIVEIWNNISAGTASGCSTNTVTANSAPTAEAGASYTIPVATPYKLTGVSTDLNGTASHSYTWEQYDLGPAGVPTNTTLTGPMVRSYRNLTPVRYIPRLQDVLINGGTSTTWEKLAFVSRVHNFEFTVRDNDLNGGQTASDNMKVTTSDTAGPFTVTSQSTNVTWQVGSSQTITWNKANTDIAPINTANVNILLSINGGTTFPYVLASNVPNDGSQNITVPNGTSTSQARIIVEGAGNIFYNVNTSNFKIVDSEFALNFTASEITVCKPNSAVYNFTYNTFSGFNQTTTFSATGVPAGANVSFSPASATTNGTAVTMTVSNIGAVAPGSYTLTVIGTATSTTNTTNVTLNVFSTSLAATTLVSPTNGATGVSAPSTLTWNPITNAQNYLVQVATDPAFTNVVNSATVSTTSYAASLVNNTQYYWRVTSSNDCATSPASSVFNFTTRNSSCDACTSSGIGTDGYLTSTTGVNFNTINNLNNNPSGDVGFSDFTSISTNVNREESYNLSVYYNPDGLYQTITYVWIDWNQNCSFNDPGEQYDLGTNVGSRTESNLLSANSPLAIVVPSNAALGSTIMRVSTKYTDPDANQFPTSCENEYDGETEDYTINVQMQLGVDEFGVGNFSIYPNPNKGQFNVSINSSSSDKIMITVYDIRGRKIYNNTFENASNFKQTINLNSVQSGMYLVEVSDGNKQITKKIIIE